MTDDKNIIEKNEERYPRFANFGEMLFWSYARSALPICLAKNLQMLVAARNMGKAKYDRACYAVRAKAFKAYKEGRSKGGTNDMDNIIFVCKHCNSSKRDTDLLEWYFEQRHEFPPIFILTHYLKQIYLYARDNDLLGKHREEMDEMQLPFNYKYIPLKYPQPECFI